MRRYSLSKTEGESMLIFKIMGKITQKLTILYFLKVFDTKSLNKEIIKADKVDKENIPIKSPHIHMSYIQFTKYCYL